MTQESLRRGQELQRAIKECREFYEVLDNVDKGKSTYAMLTLTAKGSLNNPGLTLTKFPNLVDAFAHALLVELVELENEFRKL